MINFEFYVCIYKIWSYRSIRNVLPMNFEFYKHKLKFERANVH